MGSMRQLASMIRHVHEVHSQGITEDNNDEAALLVPSEADIAQAIALGVGRREPADPVYQQD
jgi:hypothetical protein